jgi:hypothetical protein
MTFATRLRARNDAPGKHRPIPCNQQGGLHRMVTFYPQMPPVFPDRSRNHYRPNRTTEFRVSGIDMLRCAPSDVLRDLPNFEETCLYWSFEFG